MKMCGRNNLALLWLTVVNAIGQPPGTRLWEVATGNHYGSAPALAQDGTIYVGGYPGKFFALNPNGTVKWTYALGGEIWGSPAIGADGTIYATSSDQKIYAFDPAGTKLWDFNLGEWVFASVPALGADGSIYVGASALFALEPDGRLRWQFQAGGLVTSPVLGPEGSIYFGVQNERFCALDPDGSQKWDHPMDGENIAAAIGQDGTIYVVGSIFPNKLFAFTPNGTKKWESVIGPDYSQGASPPVIGSDGTLYLTSGTDLKLYAFNSDGTVKWTYDPHANIGGLAPAPGLAADGTIYFSIGLTFYAADSTGKPFWQISTQGGFSSPAIGADGTVYVGSAADTFYALKGTSPPAQSPWPLFQRDARRTGRTRSSSAPEIIITSPNRNAKFSTSASIPFSVAADTDGTIAQIELYVDANPIGVLRSRPFSLTVNSLPAGTHVFTAKGTDDRGAMSSSSPVTITVGQPPVAIARVTPTVVISSNIADAVVISSNNENASVLVDGTLSYDPDHDPLQYAWFQEGSVVPFATSVVATRDLAVGRHEISLQVSDGIDTNTDNITIEVITACEAVEEVIALLKGAQIAAHQRRPLVSSLQSACASFDRLRTRAGAAQLAAFQHKVRSQIAPLDQVLAGALIQAAQKIIDAVSGPAVRPRIISAGQDLDRHFRIQFAADAGPTYFIQSSSSLIRWVTVGTAIRMKDGSFEFVDATVAHLPSLCYRIVSPYPVELPGSGQSSTESGLNH
jgi:outer membrane protein assembly factor BamB